MSNTNFRRQSVVVARQLPAVLRRRFAVKTKLLVSMYQILGLLADAFRIRWPSKYGRSLGEVSGIANLNPLALVSLECELKYDYHASLLQSTLLPLAIVALLLLLHSTFSSRAYHTSAAFCAVASSAVMLLVFPRNTTALFSAFSCVQFGASDDGASTSRLQVSSACTWRLLEAHERPRRSHVAVSLPHIRTNARHTCERQATQSLLHEEVSSKQPSFIFPLRRPQLPA